MSAPTYCSVCLLVSAAQYLLLSMSTPIYCPRCLLLPNAHLTVLAPVYGSVCLLLPAAYHVCSCLLLIVSAPAYCTVYLLLPIIHHVCACHTVTKTDAKFRCIWWMSQYQTIGLMEFSNMCISTGTADISNTLQYPQLNFSTLSNMNIRISLHIAEFSNILQHM